MASIRQRAGSWNVYWRLGGRGGTTQSTTWEAEEDALEAKRIAEEHGHRWTAGQVEAAILGDDPDSDNHDGDQGSQLPTLAEWFETWIEAKTRISPNTINGYTRQFRLEILPAMGHKHLDEIEGVDVSRLIKALRACDCDGSKRGDRCRRNKTGRHGLSDVTITRYYSALHACLEYAVVEKKIGDNPARRTDYVRDVIAHDDAGDDGEGHVYLSSAEYHLLLDAVHLDARPLIEFLAGTGARFSEATAVAVGAFDPLAAEPAVRIHRAWKHDGKGRWTLGSTKASNRRSVQVGQQVIDPCLPLAAGEPGDALLFRSPLPLGASGSRRDPDRDRVDYSTFRRDYWEPAVLAAMRCPLHPPAPRGRRVDASELAGPRCGDNGGVRDRPGAGRGEPCGARVWSGWDRCMPHVEPARDAVSDCDCPTRLRRRPTIHDLRHSHVAQLIAAGEPMAGISQRIGHKSTAITEAVYAGILPEVHGSMAASIDRALRRPGSVADETARVLG